MVTKGLRSFDAFPKLDETYTDRRQPSNPMTYLFMIFSVFLLYLETSSWIGPNTIQRFDVDRGVADTFQINLEITVFRPCREIGIFIQDLSDDSLLVNELVQVKSEFPFGESGEEWCHMGGIFDTNRVRGRLVLGGRATGNLANTSHYISELSFGDYYPQMVNPLDDTAKVLDKPQAVTYYLSIVPTTFEAFGVQLETNQYTVTEAVNSQESLVMGSQIIFEYDFDPIKVTISDNRMSFFAWLTRVTNIVGGVFFAVKAVNRLVKKRSSSRTATGLLDKPKE